MRLQLLFLSTQMRYIAKILFLYKFFFAIWPRIIHHFDVVRVICIGKHFRYLYYSIILMYMDMRPFESAALRKIHQNMLYKYKMVGTNQSSS